MALVATGPMQLLTTANSKRDKNTKTEHDDIQTSIAFTYDTGGRDCCDCVFCVAAQKKLIALREDLKDSLKDLWDSYLQFCQCLIRLSTNYRGASVELNGICYVVLVISPSNDYLDVCSLNNWRYPLNLTEFISLQSTREVWILNEGVHDIPASLRCGAPS